MAQPGNEKRLSDDDIHSRVIMLLEWRDYFSISTIAHTRAANKYSSYSHILTTLQAFFTITIVGFAANTHLNGSKFGLGIHYDAVFAVFGGVAAFIFVLDLYFNFKEKSFLHKQCSKEAHNLKRKISRYLCYKDLPDYIAHSINKEAHYIEQHFPITSQKIWDDARDEFKYRRIHTQRFSSAFLKRVEERFSLKFDLDKDIDRKS